MTDEIQTSAVPALERRNSAGGLLHARIAGCAVAAVVFAIGLAGGGYELPASGEVVLLAAWPLLIGAIIGFVPVNRPSAPVLLACTFAALLVVWSLISIGWSEAAGRSVVVAIQYAAVFSVLLLGAVFFRAEDRTHVLGGLLGGVGLVAGLAVASRFHPDLAPQPSAIVGADRMQARLHWPVGYWNTLGFLAAMAIPLGLHFAADAKRLLSRFAAAASVPVLAICILLTLSRGSILIAALAVGASVVLSPLSLRRLVLLGAQAAGAAILVTEALSRQALMDGLTGRGAGVTQAGEMETLVVLVAFGVGSIAVALSFVPVPSWGQGTKVRPWLRAGVCAALILAVGGGGLAAGGGPRVERAWNDFRSPSLQVEQGRANSVERLSALGSSGRWQLWKGAVEEGNSAPLKGTGAGSYELWWNANSPSLMVVRNVHAQYLEVYAELGLIGVILMLGFLVGLAWGCVLSLKRSGPDLGAVAAASTTLLCFTVSSAFDWGWQVTVLPLVAMVAFAAAAAPSRQVGEQERWLAPAGGRLVLGFTAAALIALALPPVVATHSITRSQKAVGSGDLTVALSQAKSAVAWQPYSAAAWLQEGLVYDRLGAGRQARAAIVKATDREPNGWKNWYALSGVEARAGNVKASLRAYRRARDLNPNSPLFQVGN
ncbi:MAG: O-antigen ligase family protein [Actinomycetes bacterium]